MRRHMHGIALAIVLFGCGNESPRTEPPEAPRASFSIHEWGLFGIEASAPGRAMLATSASANGPASATPIAPVHNSSSHARPGKPVLYVHLGPGTDRVALDVLLGLPSASLVERWPTGAALEERERGARAGWRGVVVTRGPCTAPSPLPTAASSECTSVADGFCEAAEIERYAGDNASCLSVAGARSELLFYRASGVQTRGLPLELVPVGDDFTIRRTGAIEGPIFYVEAASQASVPRIREITMSHFDRPLESLEGPPVTTREVREAFLTHAMVLGLTEIEADAFVDAWAPAFFETQRRTGAVASGAPPSALGGARRSLLYFAPRSAIDQMLPLETRPAASETKRVFLVRVVDARTSFPARDPNIGTLGHGGGSGEAPSRCEHDCPRVARQVTEVAPGLDREVVDRVVRRTTGMLGYCYEQGLREDPALTGTIDLWLAIRRSGAVAASRIRGGTMQNDRVRACIESASRRWTFPAHTAATAVSVRELLTFSIENPSR